MQEIAIPLPPLPRHVAKGKLLELLRNTHTGAGNGIAAEALARALQISPRVLRLLITEARDEGVAIAGMPNTGYYLAANPAELDACCAWLRARALQTLHIEAQLRRMPLADVVSQLALQPE